MQYAATLVVVHGPWHLTEQGLALSAEVLTEDSLKQSCTIQWAVPFNKDALHR